MDLWFLVEEGLGAVLAFIIGLVWGRYRGHLVGDKAKDEHYWRHPIRFAASEELHAKMTRKYDRLRMAETVLVLALAVVLWIALEKRS